MSSPESTCWTLIREAAAGGAAEREVFARRYAPVVRAYLRARWRGSPWLQDAPDAVQEVFLECFKQGGVLDRADPARDGGFRAFLYGTIRNVARMHEERCTRRGEHSFPTGLEEHHAADPEATLSRIFDRAWAESLLREATHVQQERARQSGERALKRVELLRLRFGDGLSIREIAGRWEAEPAFVHHEYAHARRDFEAALKEVVAFHHPGTPGEIERACVDLLGYLD